MLSGLAAPGQGFGQFGDLRAVLAQRHQPLQKRLSTVDATLLDIRSHTLDRLAPDLAEEFPRLAPLALPDPGPAGDENRLFDIALLECLLGLGDRILGLEPGRRQFLPSQLHPSIPGGSLVEDSPAHREPAILHVLLGLRDPQCLLLLGLLVLDDGLANRRPKLGDLRQGPAELLGLVAVGQRRLETMGGQILLPALNHGPRQPAEEPLTVMMAAHILRLGDLVGFIKPAVRQRTLSLSDSQDQHGRTPWIYDLPFMICDLDGCRVYRRDARNQPATLEIIIHKSSIINSQWARPS